MRSVMKKSNVHGFIAFLCLCLCLTIVPTNGEIPGKSSENPTDESNEEVSVLEDLKSQINELKKLRLEDQQKMDNLEKEMNSSRNFPAELVNKTLESLSLSLLVHEKRPVEPSNITARGLEPFPKSCDQIHPKPSQSRHTIYPNGRDKPGIIVWCDLETDGGGWTIIQKRNSGPREYFYRDWADYEYGFGSVYGVYWIGLPAIYNLTKDLDQELRIDLWDFYIGYAYAKYSNFSVGNSSDFYRLSIGGYSGVAGDSLRSNNGMKFSTKDKDNDDDASQNCAKSCSGAWWYSNCGDSNLNGLYYEKLEKSRSAMSWSRWKGLNTLRRAEMKIRRRN